MFRHQTFCSGLHLKPKRFTTSFCSYGASA
jgi:hypothetical protein